MKKLLTFALMLALVISLVGCSMLPEEVVSKVEDIKNSVINLIIPTHEHNFVVLERTPATCFEDGYEKLACDCGEVQENILVCTGHNMERTSGFDPTCTRPGTIYYKCSVCGEKEKKSYEAFGHNFQKTEASRYAYCQNEGCTFYSADYPTDGKYADVFVFTFGDEDKQALEDKHNEMVAYLEACDKYDPALHAYAEEGELYDAYEAAYAIYEEYSNLIYKAMDQYSIASLLYDCDYTNKDLEATYNEMADYYDTLVSKFYSLSQPWYDSMYREFFFYGATDGEIAEFLFESNALANPEYAALKARNTAIELEFNLIANPQKDSRVPELYAEFVENNKKLAELLGYDNYLEYAYKNVYSREYTYEDAAAFSDLVKQYIVPVYNKTYSDYMAFVSNGDNYTDMDVYSYYSVVSDSVLDTEKSNAIFNDFIDNAGLAFSINVDKQVSFSDALNGLFSDGNLFRGSLNRAYVSSLRDSKVPYAYFGTGRDDVFTITHEFGHYMNEVYNEGEYDQSYDLLEIHSQGHEMLLLSYLEDVLTEGGYKIVKMEQMVNLFYIIVNAVAIDSFEQAIYLDSYDGYYASSIMADGTITANEYDTLFESINIDLGVSKDIAALDYWRYGMTIYSPCYYISYSVSAINALQLYVMAENVGFDAAADCYLKLFDYTDVDPEMNMDEVLEYAGLKSYKDEDLYKEFYQMFK